MKKSLETVRNEYQQFLCTHRGLTVEDFPTFWTWVVANYSFWLLQRTHAATVYFTYLRIFTATGVRR